MRYRHESIIREVAEGGYEVEQAVAKSGDGKSSGQICWDSLLRWRAVGVSPINTIRLDESETFSTTPALVYWLRALDFIIAT